MCLSLGKSEKLVTPGWFGFKRLGSALNAVDKTLYSVIRSQETIQYNFLQDFLTAQTHVYKVLKKCAKQISPYSQAFTGKYFS